MMTDSSGFVSLAALICEPSRARILWQLLDGRAYTATELAVQADLSTTSVSNHLSKLLKGEILQVASQGRHRYYSFASEEVAYVVESMANLAKQNNDGARTKKKGIQYCRSCYDHLAGYVGVSVTEAMEQKGYLYRADQHFDVSSDGWSWLARMTIDTSVFHKSRRPLTRQCLDWSERRPHLAGHLGAILFDKMLEKSWFRRVNFSRELIVTSIGKQEIYHELGLLL